MRVTATIVACVAIVGGLVVFSFDSSADESDEAASGDVVSARPRRWRSSPVESASSELHVRQNVVLPEVQQPVPPLEDPVLAQIGALTTGLSQEPPDHAAGLALRGLLEERTAELPVAVEDVTCGTSICRVTLRTDESEPNPAEVVSGLVNGPPFTDGPGGSVSFPGESTNDLSVAVVHLVRPGHSLPN